MSAPLGSVATTTSGGGQPEPFRFSLAQVWAPFSTSPALADSQGGEDPALLGLTRLLMLTL